MSSSIVNLVYLIAGILFILGIKGLTKPSTAVRGNMLSAFGMLIAVVVTLLNSEIINFTYIVAGVLFGGAVGAFMALRIQSLNATDGCLAQWFWRWRIINDRFS